jgi:hypothetical protein
MSPRSIILSLISVGIINVVVQWDLACCIEYSRLSNQHLILGLEL